MQTRQHSRAPTGDAYLTKQAENAIRDRLNDPNSAIFRDEFVRRGAPGSAIVCGAFSGKNAYGGYGDFKAFAYFVGPISDRQIAAINVPLSKQGGKLVTGDDEATAWQMAGAPRSGPLAEAFGLTRVCINSPTQAASAPEAHGADDAAAQKAVSEAQQEVCTQLKDCDGAKFRNGKIVQNQGRYIACGEVSSRSEAAGSSDYQIWIKLIGSSAPPTLEQSFPQSTRETMQTGPCARPLQSASH